MARPEDLSLLDSKGSQVATPSHLLEQRGRIFVHLPPIRNAMDHSNFSAKLEPFMLMAKSMKGAAAAKLVQDATAAPGVFVFSELLELPNIQEVRIAYGSFEIYSIMTICS